MAIAACPDCAKARARPVSMPCIARLELLGGLEFRNRLIGLAEFQQHGAQGFVPLWNLRRKPRRPGKLRPRQFEVARLLSGISGVKCGIGLCDSFRVRRAGACAASRRGTTSATQHTSARRIVQPRRIGYFSGTAGGSLSCRFTTNLNSRLASANCPVAL